MLFRWIALILVVRHLQCLHQLVAGVTRHDDLIYEATLGSAVRVGELAFVLLATNARIYSQPFADALCGLYDYCKHPEHCALTATIDPYHEPADPAVMERYRALPFYV